MTTADGGFPMLMAQKTKIVATIGPASEEPEVMEAMIRAGLDIARINMAHGDFAGHARVIGRLRAAAAKAGRRIAVMADLPGPKMRIGKLAQEPVELLPGSLFTLTTEEIVGGPQRVSVSFHRLPQAVRVGDTLFLNDGQIQLEALKVAEREVVCRVVVGGELRSQKGLNLPGIDLGIGAFTEHDRKCLRFAMDHGVDAVSQSFVESAADIRAVREAAAELGYDPFVIAKIERSRALNHLDDILEACDGIMVARGDLGVEIPIEQIALVQKRLIQSANRAEKPVITATQMLQSMVGNRRPTRAESTDVANAVIDGTDGVMLSEESAMGRYPAMAVAMLAKIAAATEALRIRHTLHDRSRPGGDAGPVRLTDLIAQSVSKVLESVSPAAVFVPTQSGYTARLIARFKPAVWIVAVSARETTCQRLVFSRGVHPVHEPDIPDDWNPYVRQWLADHALAGGLALLTEGPSTAHPEKNHRMEIIRLDGE